MADSPDSSTRDTDPGGPPPPGVETAVPHPARVRNFWLGGRDYFKADRIAGAHLAQEYPHLPETARAERAFLVRAIRFLAGPARIRQFLDIGSGLPAGGNTHEIAQRIVPDTGIVYVDNDPVVLAHAKALLDTAGAPGGGAPFGSVSGRAALGGAGAVLGEAAAIRGGYVNGPGPVNYLDADLRDVAAVLNGAASTLDFGRPVALIMVGILGRLTDYGAARSIVSQLLGSLPPGSYLAVADGVSTDDTVNRAQLRFNSRADALYGPHADLCYLRKPDEFASFFDGLDLVEPGVVTCAKWKPDRAGAGEQGAPVHCGVART
ncbi:MAG TPA: SAM-dependent methyltransferase [Streptosporangiaceae bacterium]